MHNSARLPSTLSIVGAIDATTRRPLFPDELGPYMPSPSHPLYVIYSFDRNPIDCPLFFHSILSLSGYCLILDWIGIRIRPNFVIIYQVISLGTNSRLSFIPRLIYRSSLLSVGSLPISPAATRHF